MLPDDLTEAPSASRAASSPDAGLEPVLPTKETALEHTGAFRPWLLLFVVGLLAGFVSWGVEESALVQFSPTFHMSRELASRIQTSTREVARQKRVFTIQTAMVSYGSLGAVFCIGLGAVGGILTRSRTRAITAATIGLVLGVAVTVLSVRLLLPMYFQAWEDSPDHLSHDITYPLMIHLGIWSGLGLIGGLALGIGIGSWGVAVEGGIGGVLGVALGTILFDCLGATFFPLEGTWEPISHSVTTRLLAHICVAVMATAGVAWSIRSWIRAKATSVTPP